ncbi:MAG: release factor glutamine methyltransferase, partial [Alphaproteobacteria bacterium]|nr:release factor glutamine methyltransferase [Alphaproteobacteria bacterium]
MNGTSIGEARRSLAQTFRRALLDSPELDARILVAHALGLDHATLASQTERGLTTEEARRIAGLAARRLGREPVARILGVKEFWGLSLALNADTLVPRPDSEIIVEAALAALPPLQTDERRARPWRIADLGTGSGALLLALLSELPTARGIGTDISLPALACARANAQALGCADRVAFVACDYAAALAGPFDLIVCNPPYVLRDDMERLPAEVRLFDPPRALDGGPDGL